MPTERRTWLFFVGPPTIADLGIDADGDRHLVAVSYDGIAQHDFYDRGAYLPFDTERAKPYALGLLIALVAQHCRTTPNA